MIIMKKKDFYVATMAGDSSRVIEKYGLGMEIDDFIYAGAMDAEKLPDITGPEKRFMHGPFNEIYPSAIEPAARKMAMERLDRAYEIAVHYGIKDMVVHSGYVPLVYDKEWYFGHAPGFWQEYMNDKAPDFHIYIENVMDDEPGMMVRVARRINDPRVGLCLDIGHARCVSSFAPEEWISTMAPYLRHFHFHSNDGKADEHLPLGQGTVDMEKVLSAVDDHCSRDVTATIESYHAEPSAEWLKERGILDAR